MAVGRMEACRELLVSHGSVIGTLFDKHGPNANDVKTFIRYGFFGTATREPKAPGVDDKVAEILRTGKVTF